MAGNFAKIDHSRLLHGGRVSLSLNCMCGLNEEQAGVSEQWREGKARREKEGKGVCFVRLLCSR